MATNRKDLKSYVRYDGSGRVIPGSNVLRKNMPKVGKWKETQTYECCDPFLTSTTTSTTTEAPLQALRLTFDSIENADLLVGDSSDVNDWNTFFDLPTYGNPFTSVEVVGDEVRLFGGSNIIIKEGLFGDSIYGVNLIEFVDEIGCIIELEYNVFGDDNEGYGCENLTTVSLPNCVIADNYCFSACISLINVILPQLTEVGQSCFVNCTSLTTINLPQLTTAGFNCFQSCTSLTSINLAQLTVAAEGCFSYCTSLTTIDLPQLITAGDQCFFNCTSLTSINLPSLTTAGYGCFTSCSSIVTIDLPQLTTAGDYCFFDCTSLTTIDLPSCINLGSTVGDDNVFLSILGNTITATFNSVLATNNSGNPDGDIQYLEANNTVTITYV